MKVFADLGAVSNSGLLEILFPFSLSVSHQVAYFFILYGIRSSETVVADQLTYYPIIIVLKMPDRFNKPVGHETKGSESRVSEELLARRSEPVVTTEAAPEPAEAQDPPPAAPAQTRHAPAAAAVPPNRPRENQPAIPEFGRNLVLAIQKPFRVLLTIASQSAGTDDHLFAVDDFFAVLVERETDDVCGGGDASRNILHQRPAVLTLVEAEVAAGLVETTLDSRLKMNLELKRIERITVRLSQLAANLK